MRKFGFILAAVSAVALGSLWISQPARADAGATIAIAGTLGWGWCHVTYGQARKTPLCFWHDYWHERLNPPAKKGKKK
jgi:hypothetical protein